MRKRRVFIEGAAYHVSSQTNNKTFIFNNTFDRNLMVLILRAAKRKYRFKLHNFCIMPSHIHLLITPANETDLPKIVQWIKTNFAKWWNHIHGSKGHLWGERFFSRPLRDIQEYLIVNYYIDQNPVKAGLVDNAPDWRASGAYYIANGQSDLIDDVEM